MNTEAGCNAAGHRRRLRPWLELDMQHEGRALIPCRDRLIADRAAWTVAIEAPDGRPDLRTELRFDGWPGCSAAESSARQRRRKRNVSNFGHFEAGRSSRLNW